MNAAEQAPEFSRIVRLNELGDGRRERQIVADGSERAALARRFGLSALDRLDASLTLAVDPLGVRMTGRLRADLAQPCVATGDPVPAVLDLPFALLFVRAGDAAQNPATDLDEIELSDEDCDVLPLEGERIDIGEAVAQSLALGLDPYPRAPDADSRLKAAGVLSESEAGPFAALAALKEKKD